MDRGEPSARRDLPVALAPRGQRATSQRLQRRLVVNEVDEDANARLYGSPHWDRVMSRAAARVLVTAERLVPRERIREQPELTLVPGFMVEAATIVPRGAAPGSMYPDYDVDVAAVGRYLEEDEAALTAHAR